MRAQTLVRAKVSLPQQSGGTHRRWRTPRLECMAWCSTIDTGGTCAKLVHEKWNWRERVLVYLVPHSMCFALQQTHCRTAQSSSCQRPVTKKLPWPCSRRWTLRFLAAFTSIVRKKLHRMHVRNTWPYLSSEKDLVLSKHKGVPGTLIPDQARSTCTPSSVPP